MVKMVNFLLYVFITIKKYGRWLIPNLPYLISEKHMSKERSASPHCPGPATFQTFGTTVLSRYRLLYEPTLPGHGGGGGEQLWTEPACGQGKVTYSVLTWPFPFRSTLTFPSTYRVSVYMHFLIFISSTEYFTQLLQFQDSLDPQTSGEKQ